MKQWNDHLNEVKALMRTLRGDTPDVMKAFSSLAQAAAMIDVAMEGADRFYPAFDFLVRGAKSPEDAIAACMFETVGEA